MTDRRPYGLILAVLLLSGPGRAQEDEFPIGAWFPGLFNQNPDRGQWNARLQLVAAANFNTIHAAQEARNRADTNQVWMAEAHRLGLNVQLHSWTQPPGWRGTQHWSQTFEAEDDTFTHDSRHGTVSADGVSARVGTHSAGLMLDTPPGRSGAGLYLRGNRHNHYTHHVFWLSTAHTTTGDTLVTAAGDTLVTAGHHHLDRQQQRHPDRHGRSTGPQKGI